MYVCIISRAITKKCYAKRHSNNIDKSKWNSKTCLRNTQREKNIKQKNKIVDIHLNISIHINILYVSSLNIPTSDTQ